MFHIMLIICNQYCIIFISFIVDVMSAYRESSHVIPLARGSRVGTLAPHKAALILDRKPSLVNSLGYRQVFPDASTSLLGCKKNAEYATHAGKLPGIIVRPFNSVWEMGCTTGLMDYSLASMDSRMLSYRHGTGRRQHTLLQAIWPPRVDGEISLEKRYYWASQWSNTHLKQEGGRSSIHWDAGLVRNVLQHCAWAIHSLVPKCSSFTCPVFIHPESLLPALQYVAHW